MTEQVKKEIIKAYAYRKTPQEVAAAMGISLEDAKRLQEENAEAIEERKSQLENGGWLK
nr:MAG TPA: Sigma-70 region 3 [Caudoviricetes sp.]